MKRIFTNKGFASFELLLAAFGVVTIMMMLTKIIWQVTAHEQIMIKEEASLRATVSGIETPCLETKAPEYFKICN